MHYLAQLKPFMTLEIEKKDMQQKKFQKLHEIYLYI